MNELDILNLPSDPFELRGKLFSYGIESRIDFSIQFIKNRYSNSEHLYKCCDFFDSIYLNVFKDSTWELNKHSRFPYVEAKHQFDYSIKHILIGSYKAGFDYLRSCLELTIVSIYFSFQKNLIEDGEWFIMEPQELIKYLQDERKWVNSNSNTPFFSKMIKRIGSNDRFKDLNDEYSYFNELQSHYNILCDYIHVKGYDFGIGNMNSLRTFISGSSLPTINEESLNTYLNILTETVEHIVLLVALYNPIILIELPLEDKFGLNEPVGFVHPWQSQGINDLIKIKYKPFIDKIKREDPEVISQKEWVNSLQDLTEEEITKQYKN